MELKLKNVRLSFPALFKASAQNPGDKAAFSASFIFPPDHEAKQQLENAIKTVAEEKWGDKAAITLKSIQEANKICLRNGNVKAQVPGYENNWFVSARCYSRPTVLDRDGSNLTEQDGKPYAGCYVHAIVDVYAMDDPKKGGKRINAALKGLMFYRDGEAFAGGKSASADDFADLMVDEVDDLA